MFLASCDNYLASQEMGKWEAKIEIFICVPSFLSFFSCIHNYQKAFVVPKEGSVSEVLAL